MDFLLNEEFDKRTKKLKYLLALLVKPKMSNGKIAYLSRSAKFPEKGTKEYKKLNNERRSLEKSLMNSGTSRIEFIEDGKKFYYILGKDKYGLDRVEKLKNFSLDLKKSDDTNQIVKFKDKDAQKPKINLPPIGDVLKNKQKMRFLPNKDYDMNDIVNIVTSNAKFKSIYMGVEGGDVQDILDKLNPQFEKSDPFDGVFVLFTDNLPKSFIDKGIRIFLLNENLVGKGTQIIKAYTNDGKFITKYKVKVLKIDLDKKQEMPHRLAASLRIPIGPSLLETINSVEFQSIVNTTNEMVKFNEFNTDIDFEEIK